LEGSKKKKTKGIFLRRERICRKNWSYKLWLNNSILEEQHFFYLAQIASNPFLVLVSWVQMYRSAGSHSKQAQMTAAITEPDQTGRK
jgi:hypothetical protein